MIWESAGIAEEVELRIRSNKLSDRLPGARLGNAHRDLTRDLVAVVAPRERVATERGTPHHESSHSTYPR